MKKSKLYNFDKEQENSSVSEPGMAYFRLNRVEGKLPLISDKELEMHCMTLEESKRLLFERIHNDFHHE